MKEKILIALSDTTLSSALSSALSKEGYVIATASSGDDALSKMQGIMPDLLLIDLVLPGTKDGYTVLAEKTLDRLITKIPTIVVSNSGVTVEMRKIPSTPTIRDYVVKAHVDPAEVVAKVNTLFGRTSTSTPPSTNTDKKVPPQSTKKILWVEDDKFLSSILYKKFESSGHVVLKASDGIEAMKILETEVPDAVVLDIMLPGADGFEILQKIRMNEKLRTVPAMMLSNLNKQSDIEKAKTLGAQKFLVKAAVSLDEIVREVDSMLKI